MKCFSQAAFLCFSIFARGKREGCVIQHNLCAWLQGCSECWMSVQMEFQQINPGIFQTPVDFGWDLLYLSVLWKGSSSIHKENQYSLWLTITRALHKKQCWIESGNTLCLQSEVIPSAQALENICKYLLEMTLTCESMIIFVPVSQQD